MIKHHSLARHFTKHITATTSSRLTYLPYNYRCNLQSKPRSSRHQSRLSLSSSTRVQDLKVKLAKAGQAGLLSYGILNCLYYISLTTFVWHWTGAGLSPASSVTSSSSSLQRTLTRLGKVSLTVWLGSQATKLFRLLGAVAMAPVADRLILFVQKRFGLKDRNQSFLYIVYSLWIIAASFYGSIILLGSLFK